MTDNVIPFPGTNPDRPANNTPDLDAWVREFIDNAGGAEAALTQLGFFGGGSGHAGFGPTGFGGPSPFGFPARPTPKLLSKRRQRATYVVRLDLDDAKPPIWRRLRLRSDLNLGTVHDIIQIAMGWTNSHLHQFKMGPAAKDFQMTPFLTDYDLMEGETDGIHERDVRLDQVLGEPGHRLFYEYDFGDSWEHTLKLEKVEPWVDGQPDATCVTGRRACPREDVGGVHGHEQALAALRGEPGDDPEETRLVLNWLPPDYDPEEFDADEVTEQLEGVFDFSRWHPGLGRLVSFGGGQLSPIAGLVTRATSERVELSDDELAMVTLRYRYLIGVVDDGVKLTPAGYLPPTLVKQIDHDLVLIDHDSRYQASTEPNTAPVRLLRDSAMALGLLRKRNGLLGPTASGKKLVDDPRGLFRHIRERLPLGRHEVEQDAGLLALLYTATGGDFFKERRTATELLTSVGWQIEDGDEYVAWHHSEPTMAVLRHLIWQGPLQRTNDPVIDPTRLGRALLAR